MLSEQFQTNMKRFSILCDMQQKHVSQKPIKLNMQTVLDTETWQEKKS